jgi:hypothetical protein
MDKSIFPPAIITICLDLQSLSDTVRCSWDRVPADGLPLSLARRMSWTAEVAPDRSENQSATARPSERESRLDFSHLDVMDTRSSEDALELLRLLRFDLAILGEEQLGDAVPSVLREIRIVSPETRCIVVTAAMDERRERAIREAGVLAILDAPLPLARLCDVVGHVSAANNH